MAKSGYPEEIQVLVQVINSISMITLKNPSSLLRREVSLMGVLQTLYPVIAVQLILGYSGWS